MTNIKIYYIYFPNEKLGEYIRNESNNENWPTASKYLEISKDYFQQINQCKQDEENNKKVKEVIANIQKWFRMVGLAILDSKEPIRTYKIEDIRPFLKETDYRKFSGFHYRYWSQAESLTGIFTEPTYVKQLIIAQQKLKGEIPWEEWETEVGLKEYIKKLTEEKTRFDIAVKSYRELAKLKSYLNDWVKLNRGKGIESHNSSDIWVRRRDGANIIFHWKVPNQKFNEIYNYLFYFYGEWREPVLWEVVDYETAQITASFSQFYNYYWHLLKSEVNGIIEHSPLIREEVCECPDFNSTPAFADFTSDYRLPLGLFRAKGGAHAKGLRPSFSNDPKTPWMGVLTLEKINIPIPKELDDDDTWKLGLKGLWDSTVGNVYFLLSDRYDPIFCWEVNYWPDRNKGNPTLDWINQSDKKNVKEWLKSYGLLEPDMEEILKKHVKASIYWREKQVWEGNYNLLHTSLIVSEVVNPAGHCITVEGNGLVLFRITESITLKMGGVAVVSKFLDCSIDMSLRDSKGQNNRQPERKVISDNRKVAEDHWVNTITYPAEEAKPGGGNNKANRMWKSGTGFLQPNLYNVDHTKSEYTFDQFIHRFILSKASPLKLRVEVDQKLINWYRNKKELIGKTGQDFYNGPIANLLNVPGYLQMKVLTSNFPFNNWFRNKLERGINLWEENPKEFYQKKLSNPMAIASIGDINRGGFEVIVISKRIKIVPNLDKIAHMGGGLWVWKERGGKKSQVITNDGTNLLPDIINECDRNHHCISEEQSDKWILFHNQNWTYNYKIPARYLSKKKEHEGLPTCQIHYDLFFYSSNEKSNSGDELHAVEIIVRRETFGTEGRITLEIVGDMTQRRTVGDPSGISPTSSIPGAGITPTITDPEPFDPNIEIPQSVIGDPTAPVEPGGSHIEVPMVPEIPAEPIETPVEIPMEPPVEPTEPPVEPKEPPTEPIPEKPLEGNDEDEDE